MRMEDYLISAIRFDQKEEESSTTRINVKKILKECV